MTLNKGKITCAVTSLLLHLFLIMELPLADLLHQPILDERGKEPRVITCNLVKKTYPVIADKIEDVVEELDRPSRYPIKPYSGIFKKTPSISSKNRQLKKKILFVRPRTRKNEPPKKNIAVSIVSSFRSQTFLNHDEADSKLKLSTDPLPKRRRKLLYVTKHNLQTENKRNIDKELLKYQHSIRKWISSHKIYPGIARRKGIEGVVTVSFSISKNGRLKDIKLITSSNYEILDKAAIRTINNSDPFTPFPESINKNELRLRLAISFKLNI